MVIICIYEIQITTLSHINNKIYIIIILITGSSGNNFTNGVGILSFG